MLCFSSVGQEFRKNITCLHQKHETIVHAAEMNNAAIEDHLLVCFATKPCDEEDPFPDDAVRHIRLGELLRYGIVNRLCLLYKQAYEPFVTSYLMPALLRSVFALGQAVCHILFGASFAEITPCTW